MPVETSRSPLDQEIAVISEKIFSHSLKIWGQPHDRQKNTLPLLSHRAVTAVTKQSPHDFKENEAAARLLGAHSYYVTDHDLVTFTMNRTN